MADLKSTEQLQRVVHIKIGETLCFPGFLESCNKTSLTKEPPHKILFKIKRRNYWGGVRLQNRGESLQLFLMTKHFLETVSTLSPTEEDFKQEERANDLLLDKPVRTIHMICLLPPCSFIRTKCFRQVYITFRKVFDQIWWRSEIYR